MTPIRPPSQLAIGQAALARGAWREARRAFRAALAREEQPEALEGLGLAGWWLDAADLVFKSRERAYRLYRQRNDRASAARVAVWLAWDSAAFRGEAHVANGWLERARELLDGVPDCPEHAWLECRQGVFALLDAADPRRALVCAEKAVRVAEKTGAANYLAIGGALRGLALVTAGDVVNGMRQLDAVNASVLAGEVGDPIAIGLSGCYLVAACERVRDSQRAIEWCTRLKAFCTTWGLKPLLGVCRTQYASVCVWRGEWAEAEKELVKATDELVSARPAMGGEGQSRLGELRRRQGRLPEAEKLFTQAGAHPLAILGRAALALDRHDPARAAELADRLLRRAPKHNRIERAAALEVIVKARIAMSDRDKARTAATELASIAEEMSTLSLHASSSAATGRLAVLAGDDEEARRRFEDAIDAYDESGAPFEAAQVRVELAEALARLGQGQEALAEVRRATEALGTLHAELELGRAQRLEERLHAPNTSGGRDSGGLSRREIEVVRLIAKGHSNPRIAERLFISDHTVHRHVANILLKLDVRSRSAIVARAATLGLL